MEVRNGKTIVWVPKEAFSSVRKLWKPEFSWVPVPVDRSLPPDQIAYIETGGGPVSPLPPPPRTPTTPLLPPPPRTPRTPLGLPPLATAGLSPRPRSGYFERSPELETAVTAGFSPGVDSDRPDTPSTATEPGSPATPRDSLAPPKPTIWRQSQDSDDHQKERSHSVEDLQPARDYSSLSWKLVDSSVPWKMVDSRDNYRPKTNLQPARWKTLDGQRDLKMSDHWQTFRREEAHWHGSEKGFAVRLDMHLNVEVEMRATVNGDITLSAEALYAL